MCLAPAAGPPDPPAQRRRYRFPRTLRLRRRVEFERALKDGRRATDQRITLWVAPNGLAHPRLGLVVGRKHGNAVRRNRLKRVLRCAFRLSQYDLPPGFVLVCAPRPGVDLELDGCRDSLLRLATRLARKYADSQ